MPAHKIDFYINLSDALRSLTNEAKRLVEMQRILQQHAPTALASNCLVNRLSAGTLFLLAGNAASAAKLKQLAPRLLTAYQELGMEVTSIRVEVQVRQAPSARTRDSKKKCLSIDSIKHLESLAQRLEDTPLKRALTRMAARQRRYSEH
jgi:hypothetical protein